MQEFKDKLEQKVVRGSIINLHQTVNGQSFFVVLNMNPLDIRYINNIAIEYEYDKIDMLSPSKLTGETEYEIVGNIFDYISNMTI